MPNYTIFDLLKQDGLTVKREAATNGGEYSSACPGCSGKDRFRSWPEEGEGGKWWCRGCNKSGDLIQYLREFRGMSFQEACEYLKYTRCKKDRKLSERRYYTPKEMRPPTKLWQQKAATLVKWGQEQLWRDGTEALNYLRSRGLTEETISKACLGLNPKELYRNRGEWGLPSELNDKGNLKRLWIPAGIVIPTFFKDQLHRIRIRRLEVNVKPKYVMLSGSSSQPMVMGNGNVSIIVESELDCLLLAQEAGDLVKIISLGNAQTRPDQETAKILLDAKVILVALNTDGPGAKEAWGWWKKHFNNTRRWPIPKRYGKDPSEALVAGLNLRAWVAAGLNAVTP